MDTVNVDSNETEASVEKDDAADAVTIVPSDDI